MSQFELFDIDNPCIGVCQSGKNGYCIGCLRSRSERQGWYQFDDAQKHRILTLLAKRHKKLASLQAEHAQLSLELVQLAVTPDMFDELTTD